MRTRPRPPPNPSATHSSVASRASGALGGEQPAVLGELLTAQVAQPRAWPDRDLDDGVDEAGGAADRRVLLPDLCLGVLLEHDQRAPWQHAGGGLLQRPQQHRALEVAARGDVDERPARPVGLVVRHKRIVNADERAEVALDELGVLDDRTRQRHHDRFARGAGVATDGGVVFSLDRRPIDLDVQVRGALLGAEQRSRRPGRRGHAVGWRNRVAVEARGPPGRRTPTPAHRGTTAAPTRPSTRRRARGAPSASRVRPAER